MKTSNLKIFTLLVLISLISLNPKTLAQDSHANEKIAGILKQMPAQDNSEINTLMKEIVTLGEPGLNAIIANIKPAGEGDDSQARFALGSMAFYLTNSKWGKS